MYTRLLAFILSMSFAGCGIETVPSEVSENEIVETSDDIEKVADTKDNTETKIAEEEVKKTEEDARLKEEEKARKAEEEKQLVKQHNSFSMMYYLAITAEEIRTSKDNRLVLEDIYTSLLNDINPGTVDEITQDHLKNLRDIIKAYINISTKRDRLQFIYNQEKAAAIRNAVPNPLAILSVSNALDWKKLALTVAYTAVDSYNNYKRAGESADLEFIMSGWELDDEEKDTVMKNRDRAFDYMVDMVQEYKLDGLKTLNEKSIEKFAEICATKNASERITLLQADEDTYSLLGNYWLQLADAYFETSDYSKCLECVEKYDNLAIDIYRQDFNYFQILPKAIVAAQETYTGDKYIGNITKYTNAIVENTSTEDWSARYFAAQVYLDLYARSNDHAYLEKAYKITKENVAVLLKNQRDINRLYLDDFVEQTAVEPDDRYMTETEKKEAKKEYKKEKKRVKDYNKAMKEKRKTELPSLYEPLILNCELLFALADEMNIDSTQKAEIDAILETDTNGVFMVKPINKEYSFKGSGIKNTIKMSKDEIIIPANLLTTESKVTVYVNEKGKKTTFDDCVITKVKREESTIDTFMAYVSSKKMKKYDWTSDSKVTVTIKYGDAYDKTADFKFAISAFKGHWYGDKVVFKAL